MAMLCVIGYGLFHHDSDVLFGMVYIIMVLLCAIGDGLYNIGTVVCYWWRLYHHGTVVCYGAIVCNHGIPVVRCVLLVMVSLIYVRCRLIYHYDRVIMILHLATVYGTLNLWNAVLTYIKLFPPISN